MSTIEVATSMETAEQEVSHHLLIDEDPDGAIKALGQVPFWFHTFCLNREQGIHSDGVAVDHRYRMPSIPKDFSGKSVLDVGAFDGFYAFLAEQRGAKRVLATDNEQYKEWVRGRWGIELEGAEGFHTIKALLDSDVEYRVLDAFAHDVLEEKFDFIFCFGILHRVVNPLGMLCILSERLEQGGEILLETYGIENGGGSEGNFVQVREPNDIYANDEFTYWGFSSGSLDALARQAGLSGFDCHGVHLIDGHPRIIGLLKQ